MQFLCQTTPISYVILIDYERLYYDHFSDILKFVELIPLSWPY